MNDQEKHDTYASSIEHIRRSVYNDPFWHDLVRFLREQIEEGIVVLRTSQDLNQIIFTQGTLTALESVLQFPEDIIAILDSEADA